MIVIKLCDCMTRDEQANSKIVPTIVVGQTRVNKRTFQWFDAVSGADSSGWS